jgi:site-specific DNA recombinase
MQPEQMRTTLLAVCPRVQVHADRVNIDLDRPALLRWLNATDDCRHEPRDVRDEENEPKGGAQSPATKLVLSIPARLQRTGKGMRIIVADGSEPANIDPGLVRILVRAHAIADQLLGDRSLSPNDIAAKEGIGPSYATRLYRLTFLAPDIIDAMLDGRQPPELTVRKLLDDTRLPLGWAEQRERLGFSQV